MGQLHVKADPFWVKPESDLVGNSYMYLASLAYQVEIAQWLPIVDFCGCKQGELRVALTPYEADYKTKLRPTSNPEALLNSKLAFVLRIEQAIQHIIISSYHIILSYHEDRAGAAHDTIHHHYRHHHRHHRHHRHHHDSC